MVSGTGSRCCTAVAFRCGRERERERGGVFHKEAKMSVDVTAAYKDTTKEMCKSENAEEAAFQIMCL